MRFGERSLVWLSRHRQAFSLRGAVDLRRIQQPLLDRTFGHMPALIWTGLTRELAAEMTERQAMFHAWDESE